MFKENRVVAQGASRSALLPGAEPSGPHTITHLRFNKKAKGRSSGWRKDIFGVEAMDIPTWGNLEDLIYVRLLVGSRFMADSALSLDQKEVSCTALRGVDS